jgi:hypothetical protein
MSIVPFLLANVEVEDMLASWKTLSPSAREHLIIFTTVALIAGSVLVWAVFIRKSRRRRHAHHHRHYPSRDLAGDAADDDDVTTQPRQRRKWRRPRREHRPRNPTLAETGGLPPVRTGKPPEPRA